MPAIVMPMVIFFAHLRTRSDFSHSRMAGFRTPVAEALARGLPEAELRLVRGARHVLPITHPEPVERAVADLIGSA